jgi:glycosyltransferase involved in cell wall biosynthesis
MNVCVALEQRFLRLPDGSVWTQAQCAFSFWKRYLDTYDGVRCLARVQDVERLEGTWHRADGPGVTFDAVPHYVGIRQFLQRAREVRAAIHGAIQPGDAFVLRVPGAIGHLAWRRLGQLGYPYGVEVIGDPHDAFAPGAVQHPLRPFLRWRLAQQLRMQCAGASAASYVTAHGLPRRYPSSCPTIIASSIELDDDAIATQPRVFERSAQPVTLVFVGSMEQYYKAPDVLIRAVAALVQRGLDLQLTMVGGGRLTGDLEMLAASLGCRSRIQFLGQVPSGREIRAELDRSDLFVLPSRSEGLPRAMLEAMARGLPCIGSDAGGIPELLPADAIVPAGDAPALANAIGALVWDPARMNRLAARNLQRVRAYRSEVLQGRRRELYGRLRADTGAWLRTHLSASAMRGEGVAG